MNKKPATETPEYRAWLEEVLDLLSQRFGVPKEGIDTQNLDVWFEAGATPAEAVQDIGDELASMRRH